MTRFPGTPLSRWSISSSASTTRTRRGAGISPCQSQGNTPPQSGVDCPARGRAASQRQAAYRASAVSHASLYCLILLRIVLRLTPSSSAALVRLPLQRARAPVIGSGTGCGRGITMRNCTTGGTRWSGYSGGLRGSGACSRDMRNRTVCLPPLSSWPVFVSHYVA
jgi:hypothetical protein